MGQHIDLINFCELVKRRGDIINQFTKQNIITKIEKFFDAPKKITKSVGEQKSKEESNRSISGWVKVSEKSYNLILQIIIKNKDLVATINNKIHTK